MKTSIIIPTVNRCASLSETIGSLLSLNSDRESWELIIVDNGSTDDTREASQAIIEANPEREIRYFFEPIPGLLSGRHRGVFESSGDILVFIDDDVDVDPEWLNSILETFRDPDVHLVGGKNLPRFLCKPPEWLDHFWNVEGPRKWLDFISVIDFGDELMELDPLFIWGLNFSVRRSSLIRLGGFHPDYVPKPFDYYQGNSETGLALKAKESGLKIMYQPRALVWHRIPENRLTFDYFEKRMFLYGVSDSYTEIRKNGGVKFDWRMIEPVLSIRKLFRRVRSRLSSRPYAVVRQRISEAWRSGFAFHQKKARQDPGLLEWVLRENYWDYRYGPYLGATIHIPDNIASSESDAGHDHILEKQS